MSFGFGRNSGPVRPPNGQNPFAQSPRPPSPQPPTSPLPDFSGAPRFPSPRPRPQSPQLPGSTFSDFPGGQRFPSPRPRPQSPQLSGPTFPDFPGGQRFPSPRPRPQSPQLSGPTFPEFSGGQRFPSPRPRPQSPQPPASSLPDFSGGQRFPSPRPRPQFPQPPASSFPEFSAAQRFPSPRTREAVIRSPSSMATPHLTPAFSQPSSASSRDSSVRWNDRQSPIRGGFGNLNQRTSSTQDVRTHSSSKVSPSQDLESSRRPSVQYNEDFLNDRDSSVQWNGRQNPIRGGFDHLNQRTSSMLDVGTSISSKVSPSQNLESSRRPPILYNEDFLNDRDSSVRWNDRQSPVRGGFGNLNQRTSSTHNVGASISSKVSPSQDLESSRRPPVHYSEEFLHEPFTNAMEGNADNAVDRHVASKRRQLPFSAVASNNSIINSTAPLSKPQRPSLSPRKSRSGSGAVSDSEYSQRMSPSAVGMNGDSSVTSIPSHPRTKRTRSPPAASGQVFLRSSASDENDTEREEQAKAKRLARFRTELDDVEPSVSVKHGENVAQNKKSSLMKAEESKNAMEDLSQDHDNEELDSTGISIIVGVCPDMCPESERGERERKGDLDRYERLDGDRNHTSKILAVKKYTRTAEREAELIRPMPILQKTMDYLLGLLDQPYDDKVLGLYNFLWDRMRAIRMDLRMQHIFNHQAITMLEQMIRLHVLAMHELCEFSKGEGFSEGFDAHLNIEQMNKTLVELFQLYDDHRKKGLFIPTEKEFRGYYALLKLDKHPGHKVEPGELSLDLAKMTPEIRQTQEILFARDVARSCRTSNFIAFFRHARKASYLQACLMHAHFSKLRTQALASLHSGLQYGQGLPVTHASKWLGMEEEDIESLLEYHGFLIKDFEEPYMVKDGPFLNDDKDYPTRCSLLVHKKKSNKVVEDVLSSHEIMPPPKIKKVEKNDNEREAWQLVQTGTPPKATDDQAIKKEAATPPIVSMQTQPNFEGSSGMQVRPVPGSRVVQPFNENQRTSIGSPRSSSKIPMTVASLRSHGLQEQPSPVTPKSSSIILGDGQLSHKNPPWTFSSDQFVRATSTSSDDSKGPIQGSPKNIVHSEFKATPPPLVSADVRELMSSDPEVACVGGTSHKAGVFMDELVMDKFNDVQEEVAYHDVQEEVEYHDVACDFDKEVAEAKLRLLLRLWRRRFARKKKLREVNRVAANAALGSLSLGPPLWQSKDKPVHPERLNIDKAVHERYENWQESRVRWNVSDLVAAKLAEKSAIPNCVCWKVISFSWMDQGTYDIEARNSLTHSSLDEWLHYKLIPSIKDEPIEGLAMSVPGLSVWRKWVPSNSTEPACYLSVIKDITPGSSEMKLVGANAMLFPISETVPWDVQRSHLHSLAMCLPVEACIPLLIISGSRQDNFEDISSSIAAKLGLEELDRSRIGSYSIIYLNKREDISQYHGYFSNQKLKDGLIWLASESRLQPLLSCVTTRELVSLHLNLCLDALDLVGSDRVGPNQYISAFNEALDRTISDIVIAAKANPTGWPCPEVFLLDESTAEFRAVKKFLPSLGWSSSEELEPFMSALGNCKLPHLPVELSWLSKGCNSEAEIEAQRQSLQDCLISYLTQTSNLMYWMMAAKEASLMVQNCTRLELLETEYKLIPSWALIFRRVFNWQLNTAAIFSHKAYVLEQSNFTCNPQFLKKAEMDVHMHHFSVHPSLDEMVEVTCSPIVSKRVRSSPKHSRNVAARTSGESMAGFTLPGHISEDKNHHSEMQVLSLHDSDIHTVKSGMDLLTEDEDDKLMQLLNQCNILQDRIEKKLSIYF